MRILNNLAFEMAKLKTDVCFEGLNFVFFCVCVQNAFKVCRGLKTEIKLTTLARASNNVSKKDF